MKKNTSNTINSVNSSGSVEKPFLPKEEYIAQLSYSSNEVHVTRRNRKTGPLVNDLAMPTCTCREDAPCKKTGCYCMKGTQQLCQVQAAYYRNYRLYNSDAGDFFEQVEFIIRHNPLPLFRWHDAGEFVDDAYFRGTVEIAKKFPEIKFLAYTKKYELVNDFLDEGNELPDNYTIRFSMWDKNWPVPNPYNLPVAYVDFKDSSLNPEFPKKVSLCPSQTDENVTCSMCRKCWNKNIKAVKFFQH